MRIADVPLDRRLIVSADTAAALSHMDKKAMLDLLERGKIKARQLADGTWRVHVDHLSEGLKALAEEETARRLIALHPSSKRKAA